MPGGPHPDRFDEAEVLYITDPAREVPDGNADLIPSAARRNLRYDIVVRALRSGKGVERSMCKGQFVLEVAVVNVGCRVDVEVLGVGDA